MTAGRTSAALALASAALCLLPAATQAAPGRSPPVPSIRWAPSRRTTPPPPAPATPPTSNRAPATPTPPAFTEADFNDCRKLPQGKAQVPVTLKPDTDVDHLIVWLSSVTCKSFVYSGALTAHNRDVTFVVPALVTPAEAYRLVLDALNSVGLTLQPAGGYFQIIETQRARSKSIPLYGYDGHRLRYRRPPAGS
jgi:general secretion pathway protein D